MYPNNYSHLTGETEKDKGGKHRETYTMSTSDVPFMLQSGLLY